MQTTDKILEKINEHKGKFFDFTNDVLICALPYEHAQPFLNEGVTREEWVEACGGTDGWSEEKVIELARSYADFAWGKIQDHRGLSAVRSVQKLSAFAWVLGKEDLYREMYLESNYRPYGAPSVAMFCREFDFPIPQDEDTQRMVAGKPCYAGCGEC